MFLFTIITNKKTHILKVGAANVRTGPGLDYEVTLRVRYGTILAPSGVSGDWLEVSIDKGGKGWIHKDLVWPGAD